MFDNPPHKARAVVAVSFDQKSIILATDSEWVSHEIDAVCNGAEDIGMFAPDEVKVPGVFLWEGTLKSVMTGAWDCQEPETQYDGKLREITPAEWPSLLAMSPPIESLGPLDDDREPPAPS